MGVNSFEWLPSNSLYNMAPESNINVTRIEKMITNWALDWGKMSFVFPHAWDKEKILNPQEELNLTAWDLRSNVLALSHRDSTASE